MSGGCLIFQLRYDGSWIESSHRDPESFTILAPEHLQRICKMFGGVHGFSNKPNFRLVLCSSRFQLAGGQAVTILDEHKNVQKIIPQEVFLPRYHVAPEYHGLYVLEMWNSPEELMRQGYGVNDVEYDAEGNGVRCLEPVWPDGCYEAIWNNPQNPFVFPRDVPTDIIEWAIWVVKLRQSIQAKELIQARKDLEEKNAAQVKEETIYELSQKRRVNVGEPMISLAGVELSDQKETACQ